jgi:serine/threonine protein kinase/tetratricopeptide (TPR) repeat protein
VEIDGINKRSGAASGKGCMGMTRLQKDQTLVSRFSLMELLGEGGMGQVWLVRDLELQVNIAIKVLNPHLATRPDLVELLKNECRNARRLIHPHIVRIFDFHRADERVFISMEYVEGEDLHVYRSRFGMLSYPDVITRLEPVLGALSYAHGMGLIHRDLKATNVLLDQQGSPRLADFGIAAVLESDRDARQITTGGSLYSMSPQQLDGRKPHASDDIYAFGILMYDLLTGHPPFYPEISPEKIRGQIPPMVNEQLERTGTGNRIPESLDQLIGRLLGKVPEERPASLGEVGEELRKILDLSSDHTLPPALAPQRDAKVPSPGEQGEIITPAEVSKKGAAPHAPSPWRGHLLKMTALILGLVVLLAGGGLLWHHLSKNPVQVTLAPDEEVTPPSEKEMARNNLQSKETEPEQVQAKPPAQVALEKEEAEKSLADYLVAKKALDGKGGAEWGGHLYTKMVQSGQEADTRFMNREYASASQKYEEALSKAKTLINGSEKAFRRLMEEGRMAMAEGDGKRAQGKFSLALMIDPTNQLARQNLDRAKKIERVIRLIDSAKRHEKLNNLPFALADYQEAMKLDSESDQAREGFDRIKGLIAEEQFKRLMSSGFAALQNNEYEMARKAFLKAESFKTGSIEVQDALAQVDQAIRLARIETLRKEALAAEQAEDWKKALESYVAVLKIDPAIQFAVRGKVLSLERVTLEKRFSFYLGRPGVLESDRHLQNAIVLLEEARKTEPMGLHLTSQIEKLDQLVTTAKTPVKVTLESDNLTQVAVYKVGRLGRFIALDLDLRPGTYTVVGTRKGYKDVRQQIVVKPGKGMRVTVVCKEKI